MGSLILSLQIYQYSGHRGPLTGTTESRIRLTNGMHCLGLGFGSRQVRPHEVISDGRVPRPCRNRHGQLSFPLASPPSLSLHSTAGCMIVEKWVVYCVDILAVPFDQGERWATPGMRSKPAFQSIVGVGRNSQCFHFTLWRDICQWILV